ncbi:MAG TPA: nicotinate phosphoribosyltransferase [Syntrophales bacterium]|nr:nicotinate phosphoribosyltransferase [Syntrophales bacterium]
MDMTNLMTTPLLTDLYQLTMLQGYLEDDMHGDAVFEFFVRKMPEQRGFFMAAGLDSVLEFLEQVRFSQAELAYLASTNRFSKKLLHYLASFRFTGSVDAMPEGTLFFADEPILRVVAPISEAQFVESRIINLLHLQSLIASKAARSVLAADGRAKLIDFGLRRAHGAEAGLYAARSSYIAGFDGTATVLAEYLYGIPAFGTMAHSFIEAHEDEKNAFLRFAFANPDIVTLLVDTYDTIRGTRLVVDISAELRRKNIPIRGIRLDSGDLAELAIQTRRVLDEGGLKDVQIFASGNIDEYVILDLYARGAPITGFGVGTKMDVSADVPYLDCAYKLMEYAGKPRLKKSEGKQTWPGRKQVYRNIQNGEMAGDILTVEGDILEGRPLIRPCMRDGKRLAKPESLAEIRSRAVEEMRSLPRHLRELRDAPPYPVRISEKLIGLKTEIEKQIGTTEEK